MQCLRHLGVKYEYELEGYQLPSGRRYLPGFLLPDFGLHVEIKPTEQITCAELQKVSEFALDADNPLLFIAGTPTNERMYLINRRTIGPLSDVEADYEGEIDQAAIIATFFELLADWGNVTFGVSPSSRGWSLKTRNDGGPGLSSKATLSQTLSVACPA